MFQERAIVIYGTRRVGKTTLGKEILRKYENTLYLNCDEPDVRAQLTDKTSSELLRFIGNVNVVLIDEAQRIPNIGITLKLIIDNAPQIQIIATGSSSFELANNISESLTGRKFEFTLYALSLGEILESSSRLEVQRNLNDFLVYGTYPAVYTDIMYREEKLRELIWWYLFHDILTYENIRKPDLLDKILRALALQIWSEVSYTEIANLVGTNKNTVNKYIELLEKTFVIFRLPSYAKNIRNEIKKWQKIYFTDLGIRNAIIWNFQHLESRTDLGALWENFCIIERRKDINNSLRASKLYFWRTRGQQEIDMIEENNGKLIAYEYKYRKKKIKFPKVFSDSYPDASLRVIYKENILDEML